MYLAWNAMQVKAKLWNGVFPCFDDSHVHSQDKNIMILFINVQHLTYNKYLYWFLKHETIT